MVHPRQRHTVAAAAEYVVVPAERIAPAPADVPAVEAASLVVAGSTALIALRDSVQLKDGERVLVRGAAGGVGTAAVQLAHALGGRVTALARDRHAALLRDLGADEVLDYGTTTPEGIGPFDVVVDTVGSELNRYRGQAGQGRPDGHDRLVAPALAAIAASTVHGARRIRAFSANPAPPYWPSWPATSRPAPCARSCRVYPLADVAAAHEAFERGGVMGKHVLAVSR